MKTTQNTLHAIEFRIYLTWYELQIAESFNDLDRIL